MLEPSNIIDLPIGRFLIISRNDWISRSLFIEGDYEHDLSFYLGTLCDNTATVIDVGANMGIFAVKAGKKCINGKVYAYEAQRIVHLQLCANIIINGLTNIYHGNFAVGLPTAAYQMVNVPVLNYAKDGNIGAVSLIDDVMQHDYKIKRELVGYEPVPLVSLDMLHPEEHIDFIKIDVEGMEYDVLEGARGIVERCNPVVYFELNDFSGKSSLDPRDWFKDRPYELIPTGHNVLAVPTQGTRFGTSLRVDGGNLILHKSV
jgi:FkbM family methyltransferase